MTFLDDLKNVTTVGNTENGAVTYTSTLNKNLDLYAQAGAMRKRLDEVEGMFGLAYGENKELALRNMSYIRDIREGLGERETFRNMMNQLIEDDEVVASKYLEFIPELGRWDDLVESYYYAKIIKKKIVSDKAISIIARQLNEDINNATLGNDISLMAKWIPSPSVKNKRRKQQANTIAHDLNIKVSDFRKVLSLLRKYIGIVETKLTDKKYEEIDFEKLPSRALFKYRGAFYRHMEDEYELFIDRVNSGEIKMNASNVLPYEIVRSYSETDGWMWEQRVGEYNASLEATWKSLDDTIGDVEENSIVVADTSGSMVGDPWYVAESLAIYCAERLNGAFKNHFITFSDKPRLVELPEDGTLRSKMVEYIKHSEIANTNIEATFDLILDVAVLSGTKPEDMPDKLIIVSDMEFDYMSTNNDVTIFESVKERYEEAGYKLPNVVFWNVDSRNDNTPVRHNEQGVALVSGLTPQIFKQVLGDFSTPEQLMLDTLNVERYDFVKEILK